MYNYNLSNKANFWKEFSSDFQDGECWGYNKFYRIENLEKDGFIDKKGKLIFKFFVRPQTYAQLCRDQKNYIKMLEKKNLYLANNLGVIKSRIPNNANNITETNETGINPITSECLDKKIINQNSIGSATNEKNALSNSSNNNNFVNSNANNVLVQSKSEENKSKVQNNSNFNGIDNNDNNNIELINIKEEEKILAEENYNIMSNAKNLTEDDVIQATNKVEQNNFINKNKNSNLELNKLRLDQYAVNKRTGIVNEDYNNININSNVYEIYNSNRAYTENIDIGENNNNIKYENQYSSKNNHILNSINTLTVSSDNINSNREKLSYKKIHTNNNNQFNLLNTIFENNPHNFPKKFNFQNKRSENNTHLPSQREEINFKQNNIANGNNQTKDFFINNLNHQNIKDNNLTENNNCIGTNNITNPEYNFNYNYNSNNENKSNQNFINKNARIGSLSSNLNNLNFNYKSTSNNLTNPNNQNNNFSSIQKPNVIVKERLGRNISNNLNSGNTDSSNKQVSENSVNKFSTENDESPSNLNFINPQKIRANQNNKDKEIEINEVDNIKTNNANNNKNNNNNNYNQINKINFKKGLVEKSNAMNKNANSNSLTNSLSNNHNINLNNLEISTEIKNNIKEIAEEGFLNKSEIKLSSCLEEKLETNQNPWISVAKSDNVEIENDHIIITEINYKDLINKKVKHKLLKCEKLLNQIKEKDEANRTTNTISNHINSNKHHHHHLTNEKLHENNTNNSSNSNNNNIKKINYNKIRKNKDSNLVNPANQIVDIRLNFNPFENNNANSNNIMLDISQNLSHDISSNNVMFINGIKKRDQYSETNNNGMDHHNYSLSSGGIFLIFIFSF